MTDGSSSPFLSAIKSGPRVTSPQPVAAAAATDEIFKELFRDDRASPARSQNTGVGDFTPFCRWCGDAHNDTEACPARLIVCQICGTPVAVEDMPIHLAACEAYVMQETARRVLQRMADAELAQVERQQRLVSTAIETDPEPPKRPPAPRLPTSLPCRWCRKIVDRAQHEGSCPERQLECDKCGAQVVLRVFDRHRAQCGAQETALKEQRQRKKRVSIADPAAAAAEVPTTQPRPRPRQRDREVASGSPTSPKPRPKRRPSGSAPRQREDPVGNVPVRFARQSGGSRVPPQQ